MGWQNRTSAEEAGDWNKYNWFEALPQPVEEPEEETTQRTASAKSSHEVVAAGTDWLNTDFFGEKAIAPQKRRRAPSPIPDTRLLFDIQNDILKALTEFNRLPAPTGDDDEYARQHKKVRTQLENGYKLMNRYLRTYVNNEVQ